MTALCCDTLRLHCFKIRNWFIRNENEAGQKIKKTIVLSSRIVEKQYDLKLYKNENIGLLQLVTLFDICLEKIVTCDSDLLGHFS